MLVLRLQMQNVQQIQQGRHLAPTLNAQPYSYIFSKCFINYLATQLFMGQMLRLQICMTCLYRN